MDAAVRAETCRKCGVGFEIPATYYKQTSPTCSRCRSVYMKAYKAEPPGTRRRIGKRGYPRKSTNGEMVLAHRLRAERALGRPLPPGAVVHHADGSRSPDAPLVICQDQAYHLLLHRRMRVKAAGGDVAKVIR